jgi:hypothetical protein
MSTIITDDLIQRLDDRYIKKSSDEMEERFDDRYIQKSGLVKTLVALATIFVGIAGIMITSYTDIQVIKAKLDKREKQIEQMEKNTNALYHLMLKQTKDK